MILPAQIRVQLEEATMALDLKITSHFYYGGKFEERDNKIYYIREIGCTSVECECDRLSLPELSAILKDDYGYKSNEMAPSKKWLTLSVHDRLSDEYSEGQNRRPAVLFQWKLNPKVNKLLLRKPELTRLPFEAFQSGPHTEPATKENLVGVLSIIKRSLCMEIMTCWRGEMMQRNLKGLSSAPKALKTQNHPKTLTEEDWEWLIVEHYMDPDFQIKSAINSENRAQLTMLPRTVSRPIWDVIYEDLGRKDGKLPDIVEIFKATQLKKDGTLEKEDAIIYV
ncbi:hypothetical protein Cgig2_033755 [Carnegiea gigantea]|uniref:PB1-like domain-containing protein n=1 Tax=Carnegiea gigantea TaxID=171969 RepID=A0A9Q1QJP8_9CARY|nr:hypothetical protein Cgig2_033755 [Carnegiea gigantea]